MGINYKITSVFMNMEFWWALTLMRIAYTSTKSASAITDGTANCAIDRRPIVAMEEVTAEEAAVDAGKTLSALGANMSHGVKMDN